MTRIGARKKVDSGYWSARLRFARGYHQSARDKLTLADEGADCAPVQSDAILAMIAYAHAVTARKAGIVNQRDHAGVTRLLRDVLGNALPAEQEQRLRRLVGQKDDVQYGVHAVRYEAASRAVEDLDRFASWVEESLR